MDGDGSMSIATGIDNDPVGDAARVDDWRVPVDATFLLLRRPDDVGAVAAGAGAFVTRASDARPDAPGHPRDLADRLAEAFANDDTFEAIRLEPYLRATAARLSQARASWPQGAPSSGLPGCSPSGP